MKPVSFTVEPINSSPLGAVIDAGAAPGEFYTQAQANPQWLSKVLNEYDGLLCIKGLVDLLPEQLVKLSYLFGEDVENYSDTPTPSEMIHSQQQQILVLSNLPPCERQPPLQPDPPRTEADTLPLQFPHRKGWHTDQSFRRPPPDISLFYAVIATPHGQGQTLFANGYNAYDALDSSLKKQIANLNGLHCLLGTGRTEQAVREGVIPKPLLAHQQSQLQPIVRVHPETGRKALYLCEYGQMDWLDGPIEGMEPGPFGDGSKLLHQLMTHYTDDQFTYAHEWDTADLVIYDNRCLIHSASWYDSENFDRMMWRTTARGNPGPEYDGEKPSWVPEQGTDPLEGLGDGRWENLTRPQN